jgi:hypothetical protein
MTLSFTISKFRLVVKLNMGEKELYPQQMKRLFDVLLAVTPGWRTHKENEYKPE